MNQSELIAKVASISGESRKAVEAVLKTTGDVIGSTLSEGGDVALPHKAEGSTASRASAAIRKRVKPSRSRPSRNRISARPRP